jgi:hypothetical protein
MLFHQPHSYKVIIKLLQSSNSELLFNSIMPLELSHFLKLCLLYKSSSTLSKLKKHKFINMEHHDSKLQLEQELVDYIESKKLKKNILEDHSTVILNSVRDEDSKLNFTTSKAKTNMRMKKKRIK